MATTNSKKPIFVATHPRACSTAFERVFMTCRDTLQCVHEPFGDAWYFGPERLHDRYEKDEKAREESGYANSTYKTIFDSIEQENTQGKRIFIKDMAQYWIPPNGLPASIAPSLVSYKRGVGTENVSTSGAGHLNTDVSPASNAREVQDNGYPYDTVAEPGNPTVIPDALLRQFHFTFLIRHPRSSIPSYYRCTVPPLDDVTGFHKFNPNEAGYVELRALLDYLRNSGQVGPHITGQADQSNGTNGATSGATDKVDITLIDADDLLDSPYAMIEEYCKAVGIPFTPDMLNWDNDVDQENAKAAFEKWPGFHDDAIESTELRPRKVKKAHKSDEELYKEWVKKFGQEQADEIMGTVKENEEHYEYLKKFAIKLA
ncbi:hypothetical protein EJ08DRAFT_733721 [Tothia fuscella]|uniref:P-loop containing nucleoside triphosphate hydrolase protein n=1 Tax=Tothia fuscella TaxID=1048955 RepID=A0A9P4NRT9_9PEZI|nr:hypothetical protein EJ08DRAFT_733721 [Tothia fuscella]